MKHELDILKERLDKIGIEIEFIMNFPWVYLHKINGKVVTERYQAEHGFTVGFLPIKLDRKFNFTDISEIFKLIRKYK